MADELERALRQRDLALMAEPRGRGVAPRKPGLMDLPGGVTDRLALLNQLFNPVEAMGQSMRAGERMMSPDMAGYDRLAALGDMLSGVAGVAGPAAVARRVGGPAATAIMEGLLGGSPTTQAAGDMARQFGVSEYGGVPVPRALSTSEGSKRVSTRFPTGAKATESPISNQLSMNFNEALAGDMGAYNARLLSGYPGFARLAEMSPEEAARAYVDQTAGNLRFLIDRMPEGSVGQTKQWYEGANRISDAIANRIGVPRQSASAALAALSPQKDWFQNASLGERLADIVSGQYDKPATNAMMDFIINNPKINTPQYVDEIATMGGKPFSSLSPLQKAIYVRAYDEVYNPRAYREVTPEGLLGDFILTGKGEPAKVAWGSFNEIGKAIRALESGGDMNVISPLLGERHKVRSFYNNIEDPNEYWGEFGDVTGDTHAVAANQLRPLSGNTTAVAQNFGNALDKKYQGADWVPAKGSSVTGVQGTYGFNTEPYRVVAPEYGLRPRAGQSVGWEAVRALFPDTFKTEKNMNVIDSIWREYDAGNITIDEARSAIFNAAGGFTGGNWGQSPAGLLDPAFGSTYR